MWLGKREELGSLSTFQNTTFPTRQLGFGPAPGAAGRAIVAPDAAPRWKSYGVSVDDLEISALLTRLSRPHPTGGVVIERAAILAAGADFPAIIAWITDRAGVPDTTVSSKRSRGLHGTRVGDGGATAPAAPQRYVLPAGALR